MTPAEYVTECSNPGDPVGAQFVQAEVFGSADGWTQEQIEEAKNLILARYENNPRFVFPRKVRYDS